MNDNDIEWALGAAPSADQRVRVQSWLLAGVVVVMLVLFALQQSLRLGAHIDVETWLGLRKDEAIRDALVAWFGQGLSRLPAVAAYLLIDTALFIPLYGLTLLWATRQAMLALAPNPAEPARVALFLGRHLTPIAIAALWVVDATENLGGLARLGGPWMAWGFVALLLAVVVLAVLRTWAQSLSGPTPRIGRLAQGRTPFVLAALVLAAVVSIAAYPALFGNHAYDLPPSNASFGTATGWAHSAKFKLLGLACSPLIVLSVTWWFGIDLSANAQAADVRAAHRQGVLGVVGRSRYVLAMLALFGAFTLVLDQCRDVVLAMAAGSADDRLIVPRGVVMLSSALGLGLFAHACWLWTRLVGRVKRNGYELPQGNGIPEWVGAWARSWARMLMLVPLLMTSVLLAYVTGDAVVAAAVIDPADGAAAELLGTLIWLAVFALTVAGFAFGLMRQRRLTPLPRLRDYYNCVPDLRPLIHDPAYMPGAALKRRSFGPRTLLSNPAWQPVLCLLLMVLLRSAMAVMPEQTGWVPPSLALLCFASVWWLGPLGLIAMSEQRGSIPWTLLLVVVVALCALVSDNHLLPGLVFDNLDNVKNVEAVESALRSLREVNLSGVILLAGGCALAWWALVKPVLRDRFRVGIALGLYFVVCLGMKGLGHRTDEIVAAVDPEIAPKQDAVWSPHTSEPNFGGTAPLLLIATEGGGSRSAYWTARMLAELSDKQSARMSRVVAMSGVSGGSMGLAVWRACVRSAKPKGVTRCVEDGFRSLDPLSRLVAGLMFDDVWMRLLPTNWLCADRSGCAMRSRALAFEAEWMRAFPRLGESVEGREGEPLLLFNSTVVENGNRAVIATVPLPPDTLGGAYDLRDARSGLNSVSLITAAHTSARFPFINPLASLPKKVRSVGGAHLADGGYHDNSGAATLSDLLPLMEKTFGEHHVQLVLVRNGQVAENRDEKAQAKTVEKAADAADTACKLPASDPDAVTRPKDSSRLHLYADLLGPAVALINVAGTGAHGREPVASLALRVGAHVDRPLTTPIGCAENDALCLLDQVHNGALLPLGWSLSPLARMAMNARASTLLADCMHEAPANATHDP